MKKLVTLDSLSGLFDKKVSLSKLQKKHIINAIKFIDRMNKNVFIYYQNSDKSYYCDCNNNVIVFTNLKKVKSFIKNNIA